MPVIVFENVNMNFGAQRVLENISFTLEKNDYCGIIGPNGGGKTTILKLILGFIKPSTGKITVLGKNPKFSGNQIGYVPQFNKMDDHFPITVEQVVSMGTMKKFSLFPSIRNEEKIRIFEALSKVKMEDHIHKNFGNLSGGMKQRVLIARAIVSHPELLILDEPTASVDPDVEKDIYSLISSLKENMTIIMVSHDMNIISSAANKVLCINRRASFHSPEYPEFHDFSNNIYNPEIKIVKHHCGI
ncbi:MAG: ABC transporter ATP-binding protein [Candidatus Delongbacteria bacterium]|nr:ABC transporter ATP-binding protein [Candidatus Delongbacteria bacterium]MBN2836030.1 ABC transporter ATP-binding protein [Candidatus Delongbacteria bacterium]